MNLKIYLENLNIKYIRSAPYHQQSNGCCEALHKQVKQYLLDDYDKKKKKFDIDIAIVNFSEFHNDLEHTITKYKPNFLRNLEDKNIIEEVIQNILHSMKRKLEYYDHYPKYNVIIKSGYCIKRKYFFYLKKKEKKFYYSLFINKLY